MSTHGYESVHFMHYSSYKFKYVINNAFAVIPVRNSYIHETWEFMEFRMMKSHARILIWMKQEI